MKIDIYVFGFGNKGVLINLHFFPTKFVKSRVWKKSIELITLKVNLIALQ